jgi:hypothetical protein
MVTPDGYRAAATLAVFRTPTFGGIPPRRAIALGKPWIEETEPALAIGGLAAEVIHRTGSAHVGDALVGRSAVVVDDTGLAILAGGARAHGSVHVDALVGSEAVVVDDAGLVVVPRAANSGRNRFTGLGLHEHQVKDAVATL